MRGYIFAGFRVAVVLMIGSACTRSTTTTYSSKEGSVTVDQKGKDGGMTIAAEDGQKVVLDSAAGGRVPDDYPKDVPVYTDAKVTMSQSATEKHTRIMLLESSRPPEKIADFYKQGLEGNGWKVDTNVSVPQVIVLTAIKEKRQAVVQIMSAGDKRTINQILSDKE